MGWASLAACAALLCLAAIAPASALAGSISGTVTEASTHEPIAGLEVCAYPIEEEEQEFFEEWFCEDTDAGGEYSIEDLGAGEYGIEFWGRPLGYIPQFFDGMSKWWEWNPVLVGSGAVTAIDAEMVAGGGIEGTIDRAADGAPVEGALACAWTITGEEFGGCAEADSSGEYSLKGMPAGEYEVEFWAEEQGFLSQFYDHKTNWWEADPVIVSLGATATEIDADLLPAAKVEGTVRRASTGAPLSEVEVCAWSTDSEWLRCDYPSGDGHYSIVGLPPDVYKVEFWPFEEDLPIQYWDHKASWEAANVLPLNGGSVATGIDADLGSPPSAPSVAVPPIAGPAPAPTTKPPVHRLRCKKGFRKKRVRGKVRCVKRKKHKHRRHAKARPAVPTRAAFRPGR